MKLPCGVKCHGVILTVLWYGYGYAQRSEQFALSVLCSVQRNVSSVLFMCLCQQDSVYTVFSVSLQGRLSSIAFNASSVQSLQHQFSFLSVFSLQGRVCSIHSQQCSVAWLQSTAFMVCLLLFSVGSVLSSIQLSVGCRVCSVQCLQRSGCVLLSGSFSACTLQCLQCSEHWLFTKSLSCSCHVQSPHFECPLPLRSQILNFNTPSTTGHLRTM